MLSWKWREYPTGSSVLLQALLSAIASDQTPLQQLHRTRLLGLRRRTGPPRPFASFPHLFHSPLTICTTASTQQQIVVEVPSVDRVQATCAGILCRQRGIIVSPFVLALPLAWRRLLAIGSAAPR